MFHKFYCTLYLIIYFYIIIVILYIIYFNLFKMNIQDLILLKQCLHYPQTRCTCIISVYGFIRTSIISPNNRCLKIREEKCRGVSFWQIYNHAEYFNRFISSPLEIFASLLKFSHSFKLLTTETKVFVNCIMSAIDDSTINFLGVGTCWFYIYTVTADYTEIIL